MPIEVDLGDGTIAEFPDGMSREAIQDVLRRRGTSAPAKPAAPEMSFMQSLGRGMLSGGAMGFEDELGIADKEKQKASAKANPWTHFAGEMVGGAASMLVPGMAAARLGKVGKMALSPFVAKPVATAGQAAVQGGKLGASFGAVSGAGHADNGGRVQGALEGGTLGAGIGGALGPVAHKIGEKIGVARAARQEMANSDTASLAAIDRGLARDRIEPKTLIDQLQVPQYGKLTSDQISEVVERVGRGETVEAAAQALNIGASAARKAVQSFQQHNATPLSLVDRARLTGPAGGENTAWTLRAGMASPGQGRAIAAEQLTGRQMDQAGAGCSKR